MLTAADDMLNRTNGKRVFFQRACEMNTFLCEVFEQQKVLWSFRLHPGRDKANKHATTASGCDTTGFGTDVTDAGAAC